MCKAILYYISYYINVFMALLSNVLEQKFAQTLQTLMRALSSPPFGNYQAWWSLADSKYAGTALLIKKCFKPKSVFFNLDRKGICFSFPSNGISLFCLPCTNM